MYPETPVTMIRSHLPPYGSRRSVTTLVPFSAVQDFNPAGAPQEFGHWGGSYTFRMAAQAFRTRPTIDAAAFPARFAEALAAIMGPGHGPPGFRATATVLGVSEGAVFDPPGIAVVDHAGPTWWVTVAGTVQSPAEWYLTGATGFNRVIARALASVTTLAPTTVPTSPTVNDATFRAANPLYQPRDGGQLHTMLDHPEACGSHRNSHQMWMRACTTVLSTGNIETAPVALQSQPATPPPPGPQGSMVPIPSPEGSSCKVVIQSQAWLRPTQTFNHVGPTLPRGTMVEVLGRTALTHLTYRLYQVRVAPGASASLVGQVGYIAMDAGDVATAQPANCAGAIGGQAAPRPSSPGTPTPSALSTSGGPGTAPLGSGAGTPPRKNEEGFPVGLAVGTAVVVGGIGTAIVLMSRRKKSR